MKTLIALSLILVSGSVDVPLQPLSDENNAIYKTNEVILAMAKPPREEAPPRLGSDGLSRYIVTHDCAGSPQQVIKRILGSEPYRVDTVIQSTGQVIIDLTDRGARLLEQEPCVQQVAPDGVSAPTSG